MKKYDELLKFAYSNKLENPPRVVGLAIPSSNEILVEELKRLGYIENCSIFRKSAKEFIICFDFTFDGIEYIESLIEKV